MGIFLFLEPIIIAFAVIGLGFIFQKKIGFDQKSVNDVLIYLLVPSLSFSAIYSRKFDFGEFSSLGFACIAVLAASGIAALVLFKFIGYKKNGMLLPAMFMNSGYLGFPVAFFALGELGLQKAILFDAVETLANFTLGVFLVQSAALKKRERIVGVFKIPLIYAIVLGLAFNYFSVPLPATLIDVLKMIGNAAIPLALVALGGRLATLKLGNIKIPVAALFSRFVVGGIAAFAFIKLFNIDGVVASVILLISVMPPAVNSYVLNEKFNADPENAATAVLIGTLVSVIPIAIVLSMI